MFQVDKRIRDRTGELIVVQLPIYMFSSSKLLSFKLSIISSISLFFTLSSRTKTPLWGGKPREEEGTPKGRGIGMERRRSRGRKTQREGNRDERRRSRGRKTQREGNRDGREKK